MVTTDTSKTGLGTLCNGRTAFSSWATPLINWHINHLTFCPLRQQYGGCFHKHQGARYQVSPSAQTGELSSPIGIEEPPIIEGGSRGGFLECRSGNAVTRWTTAGGMETPPPDGECKMAHLWTSRCGSLCDEKELTLPDILCKGNGHAGPEMASAAPLCLHFCNPASAAHQLDQGGGTTLAESALVPRMDSAAVSTSMAHTTEKRPPLSNGGNNLAPPAGVIGPACMAPRWASKRIMPQCWA